jgi:hypothetical protein
MHGWRITPTGRGIVHVHPRRDQLDHVLDDSPPTCPCGPHVEPVPLEDHPGVHAFLITHASLDGRELLEDDYLGPR